MKEELSVKNNNKKEKEFKFLLKGGYLIDPANCINKKIDIAIKDRKISRVAEDIAPFKAVNVIDVSGYYVVPGLVDIHTHIYSFPPGSGYYLSRVRCVDADAHLPAAGVTTAVDAGTVGWKDFLDFKKKCID